MGFDDDAIEAQERGTPIAVPVHAVFDLADSAIGHGRSRLAQQVLGQLGPEHHANGVAQPLGCL